MSFPYHLICMYVYIHIYRPWFWQQSIMRNPQKGLTTPMWFKTLWSMVVGKSFHHLCWPRHFTKQKTWTNFPCVAIEINFCWSLLRNNCHDLLFNSLPQFLYKDIQNRIDIFCATVFFVKDLQQAITYHFYYLLRFMGSIHKKQITFTWQLFENNFMLKKCISFFFEFIYYLNIVLTTNC